MKDMEISVELFSGMKRFKPEWAEGSIFSLKLPENSTPYDVFQALNIPKDYHCFALVNGNRIPYEDPLMQNDKVSFFMFLAGG